MNIETKYPHVKAQVASCPICGNNVLIAATETNFRRDTTREFAKLMEKGYIVKSVSLEEASSTEMYCEHEPPFTVLNSDKNVQGSVATGDDSSTNAGNKAPKSTNGGEKKEEGGGF